VIQASDFIGPAKALGFNTWAGVPCSFLTPFINSVIDDPDMSYLSAANEGDAVAAATGAAITGQRTVAMMQNSGLGNAVSPLSSLNWVFRIPVLLIVTLRGEPGLQDEPQHELMGQITGAHPGRVADPVGLVSARRRLGRGCPDGGQLAHGSQRSALCLRHEKGFGRQDGVEIALAARVATSALRGR
jgi:hypothetical protein